VRPKEESSLTTAGYGVRLMMVGCVCVFFRGMAHLGVIRVLEEEGVPIDFVVGVSIGALIGALYAKHGSYLVILPYVTRFVQNMSKTWLLMLDATLPVTSYSNGRTFSKEIEKVGGRCRLPSMCALAVTHATLSSGAGARRHEDRGLLALVQLRDCGPVGVTAADTPERDTLEVSPLVASGSSVSTASFTSKLLSLCAPFPRYVRASMSLAGLLPPVCDVDPKDDSVHFLVDGGYVNNGRSRARFSCMRVVLD
jgi:predicted acylesterase/phospholipase RssA